MECCCFLSSRVKDETELFECDKYQGPGQRTENMRFIIRSVLSDGFSHIWIKDRLGNSQNFTRVERRLKFII